METDIAVLEFFDIDGNWEILTYIGSDRSGGLIEEYDPISYKGTELRIRY